MAKRLPGAPSKAQQRRWQAEDIVRRQVLEGPSFNRAVGKVVKELARIEKNIPPMKPQK